MIKDLEAHIRVVFDALNSLSHVNDKRYKDDEASKNVYNYTLTNAGHVLLSELSLIDTHLQEAAKSNTAVDSISLKRLNGELMTKWAEVNPGHRAGYASRIKTIDFVVSNVIVFSRKLLEIGDTPTPLYIFDVDGTLADCTHRRHFVDEDRWDDFYMACADDTPIKGTIAVLNNLLATGNEVWFFTGRSDISRELTVEWFLKYTNVPEEVLRGPCLVMRAQGDHTGDHTLKHLWYDSMLQMDKDRLVCVFEDRQRVVNLWRELGVQCMQVAPGNF